ncbi:MAG: N-acetylmuramoyl-L-alanine amidase [Clostridia bacterium]|nr:N-acetylmuramoyl-L-alanine amidase [Clostridia bacterium]
MRACKGAVAVLLALTCALAVSVAAAATRDVYDEPITPSQVLAGRIVVLDPGHGTGVGGSAPDYDEADYNLIFAQQTAEKLAAMGARVVMTRSEQGDVLNYHRMAQLHVMTLGLLKEQYASQLAEAEGEALAALEYDIAQMTRLQGAMNSVLEDISLADVYFNSPYDYTYQTVIHPDLRLIFEYEEHDLVRNNMLYVSIHSNAPADPDNTQTSGTTTYYLDNDWHCTQNYYTEYYNADYSEEFALLLVDRVSEAGEFNNRGAAVNDYFMLREHNLPAVLLETAYHTNPQDRAKLMDPYYQNRITTAIALAIEEYFSTKEPYEWQRYDGGALTSDVYTVDERFVTGISAQTTVAELLARIESASELSVVGADGVKPAGAYVATGDRLLLTGAEGEYERVLAVRADVSGDGNASLLDLLMIQSELLEIGGELAVCTRIAADINGSGAIELIDLLMLQQHLLGMADLG